VESDIPKPLDDGLYYVITNGEFREPITKWIDFILERRLQEPSGPRTNISFSNFCNNFNIPLESDLSQLKMFIAKSEYFYNININPIKIDHQGLMLWGLKVNFLELHGCRLIDITNLLTISYHIHINKNIDIDELLKGVYDLIAKLKIERWLYDAEFNYDNEKWRFSFRSSPSVTYYEYNLTIDEWSGLYFRLAKIFLK
jgi:hypothetical protein